jgi:glyoxylase-like metal-dependent hydrolase (beta-lactamase superfamily II)
MKLRSIGAVLCLGAVGVVAWVAGRGGADSKPGKWVEVAPGVLRSPGLPAGYALVADGRALLIDAPSPTDELKSQGIKKIDAVWLTHHHRDTVAQAGRLLAERVPVRAPRAAAPWLTPKGVRKHWNESLPLRGSRTAYLVVPEGLAGIDCSLVEGTTLDWNGWSLKVIEAPGHSMDHVAIAARKGRGPLLVFCGDALAGPGKLWSPYTTDWDHWTDAGLRPAAKSLRKLAALAPAVLLPAHGDVIRRDTVAALEKTASAVEEVAFLKSFERYTKERLKNAPKYAFLAKEQAGTNGSKPWSKISEHLWLTGNTYVLVSKDNAALVVDPWDPHSAKQIPLLQKADKRIGKIEVVLCSHAHFDHYDGAYVLLERHKPKVWALDRVATPIADPFLLRAPFLDVRPLPVHRRFKDGESANWREYRLKFHFLPGQTEYTMGVETVIDGKRCFFTADNFFHHDLFSGTGGWMGLNRSNPLMYAESAEKVLKARPDWVLAEHGSAMEFNAEDFRRRIEWGKVSAKAADALCVSGDHRQDWGPHHVRFEPVLQKAKAGETAKGWLVVDNVMGRKRTLMVTLEGRGLTADQTWKVEVPGHGNVRREVSVRLGEKVAVGRQVFALRVVEGDRVDGGEAFLVIDVAR